MEFFYGLIIGINIMILVTLGVAVFVAAQKGVKR